MPSDFGQVELTLNSNDPRYGGMVGETFKKRNSYGELNTYMIVKMGTAAGTLANGTVLYFTTATGSRNVVTDDVSTINRNDIAGVALGLITDGYYGVIQTWGTHIAVKKGTTTAVDYWASGDTVIGNATADGKPASVAAGTASTYTPLGISNAIADSADTTCSVFLKVRCA